MSATPIKAEQPALPTNQEKSDSNTEIFNAKTVVQTLEGLMVKVTEEDCTASTVNAACNCAARITDLLRVHLEVERLQRNGGGKGG